MSKTKSTTKKLPINTFSESIIFGVPCNLIIHFDENIKNRFIKIIFISYENCSFGCSVRYNIMQVHLRIVVWCCWQHIRAANCKLYESRERLKCFLHFYSLLCAFFFFSRKKKTCYSLCCSISACVVVVVVVTMFVH